PPRAFRPLRSRVIAPPLGLTGGEAALNSGAAQEYCDGRMRAIIGLLAGLAAALAAFELPAQRRANIPDFYFMRLMYSDSRGRTMARPPPYECPELGGGSFFPPQGRGWGTDYPGADCKYMHGVDRLTGVIVHPHPHVRAILD